MKRRDGSALSWRELRSGRHVRAASGVVLGQLYADAVADAARERSAAAIDPDVAAVLEAIKAGESYDDIRKRLVEAYREMKKRGATKVADVVSRSVTMAELGGRHAINEDVAEKKGH